MVSGELRGCGVCGCVGACRGQCTGSSTATAGTGREAVAGWVRSCSIFSMLQYVTCTSCATVCHVHIMCCSMSRAHHVLQYVTYISCAAVCDVHIMHTENCEGWLSPGGHSSGGRALTA